MTSITVYKLDANGDEVLHYPGDVIERGPGWVHLRATFQPSRVDLGFVVFQGGDTFHEWFYADRYYNVFRVERGTSGEVRGWYCNITRPAQITADEVRSDDLELDVFILPDGTHHILDEDEFIALSLSKTERRRARAAVDEILTLYRAGRPPFTMPR